MSTGQIRAFRPLGNSKTVNVVTTTASAFLQVPDTLGTRSVRIVNSGTDITFIEFTPGPFGVAATVAASMPMLPNTVEVFLLQNDLAYLKVIGVAGGNTIYVTYGEGL
jgi:hypothetical protein